MLDFHVITIFPEIFDGFLRTSLIGKAIEKGLLSIDLIDLRSFTTDKHRMVDDTPYGGGSGMVMKPDPIFAALGSLADGAHRALLTPQGKPFEQGAAARLVERRRLALFCGRYEGVDERVRGEFDEEISLGDFVLNGGEVAAMAVIEAVSRLEPGVLGNAESAVVESFGEGMLEYPQYTRPELFRGRSVPEVLRSGDHGKVDRWRRGQALLRTSQRRPDLFDALSLSQEDRKLLAEARAEAENGGNDEP